MLCETVVSSLQNLLFIILYDRFTNSNYCFKLEVLNFECTCERIAVQIYFRYIYCNRAFNWPMQSPLFPLSWISEFPKGRGVLSNMWRFSYTYVNVIFVWILHWFILKTAFLSTKYKLQKMFLNFGVFYTIYHKLVLKN